jgi:hypothetical protein
MTPAGRAKKIRGLGDRPDPLIFFLTSIACGPFKVFGAMRTRDDEVPARISICQWPR